MAKLISEIRKAYFLNKYAIITPSRATRPRDIKEETIIKRGDPCPFCAENLNPKEAIDAIMKKNKWSVLSLANKFPAVSENNKKAMGFQEVLVETPKHGLDMADLSVIEINKVLEMYIKRTNALMDKKMEYILCFKNQGSKAGASISHAHSQIFATKIIPPDLIQEQSLAQKYKTEKGRCPFCDIIKKEIKSARKIFNDKNIAAFTPYASEFHYEAWIFPKRHIDNITLLKKQEIESMAKTLKLILSKLKKLNLSFNYFLHNVVSDNDQHLYIKVQPRDSILGGVELGSGLIINSVSPEEAAKFYRK